MDIYENKQDFAYKELKRMVVTCELKPNEKISRKNLADEIHVGNTPIREAILRLEREGFFRTIPQSGTFVSAIDKKQVEESIFIRQTIEQIVFDEAFELATKKDFKELDKMLIIQRMAFESHDFEMLMNFDNQFHQYFYNIVDRQYTWEWINLLTAPVERILHLQSQDVETSWHETLSDHEHISKLLKNQSKEEYQALTTKHIENLQPHLERTIEKHPEYFEPAY